MHDADIRGVDDVGFYRNFMGRNERYTWDQVQGIVIGATEPEENHFTTPRVTQGMA